MDDRRERAIIPTLGPARRPFANRGPGVGPPTPPRMAPALASSPRILPRPPSSSHGCPSSRGVKCELRTSAKAPTAKRWPSAQGRRRPTMYRVCSRARSSRPSPRSQTTEPTVRGRGSRRRDCSTRSETVAPADLLERDLPADWGSPSRLRSSAAGRSWQPL